MRKTRCGEYKDVLDFGIGDYELFEEMASHEFIKWLDSPITLNSGIASRVYISGREDLTDHYDFGRNLAWKLIGVLTAEAKRRQENREPNLIGIPTAGISLAATVALTNNALARSHYNPVAYRGRHDINWRQMRWQPKKHGIHRHFVDGRPNPETYWHIAIDNVITSGDSIIRAAERLKNDGYDSKNMTYLILIDREQGGVERLIQEGFKDIVVVYKLSDIVYALGEYGFWSQDEVARILADIKATHPKS